MLGRLLLRPSVILLETAESDWLPSVFSKPVLSLLELRGGARRDGIGVLRLSILDVNSLKNKYMKLITNIDSSLLDKNLACFFTATLYLLKIELLSHNFLILS